MKYIKIFKNENDYNSFISTVDYETPNVSIILDTKDIKYNPRLAPLQYLTIESLEDELTVQLSNSNCQYSLDRKTWIDLPANTETPKIKSGEKLYFKKETQTVSSIGTFTISKKFNLSGNVMSMLFGDNAIVNTDLTGYNNAFSGLFQNCTTLQSVSNEFLPATTLSYSCYSGMFYGCTSLTKAPKLPATNLADNCYESMFQGCTSLTTAPELPATNLQSNCYMNMFYGCSNLKIAPKKLGEYVSSYCCYRMFYDCTSLETAPELPATTLANSCYIYMFTNCTSLTKAPELPATTLVNSCYSYMFMKCSKLNYIKAMFTTTPSNNYTFNWTYAVSSTGTFVKNGNAYWNVIGTNGIPENWNIEI